MPHKVLLLDVMGTLVAEPFFAVAEAMTGLDRNTLLREKDPSSWVEFEKGWISESDYFHRFFQDGRTVDAAQMRARLHAAYRWLDGMEALLGELRDAGIAMHAFSNYPVWYEMIEERLGLSQYLEWTFVSCRTGLRKPDPAAYAWALNRLGASAEDCVFVDDRAINVQAAQAFGWQGLLFRNARSLRKALHSLGFPVATMDRP